MRNILFSQSDLGQLRRHLVNSAFSFLAWVLPFITALSVARIPLIGFKPVMLATALAALGALLVYRQRHRISTPVKLWILVTVSTIVAVQGYLSFFDAPRVLLIMTLSVLIVSCGAPLKVSIGYGLFAATLPLLLISLTASEGSTLSVIITSLPGVGLALISFLMMSYLISHKLFSHMLRQSQSEYYAIRTDNSTGGLNELAIREQIDQLLADEGAPVIRVYLLHLSEITIGNNQYTEQERNLIGTYLSATLTRTLPNNTVHGRSGDGNFLVVAPRAEWTQTESALRLLKEQKVGVGGKMQLLDPVVVTTDAPSDGERSERLLDNLSRVLVRALRDKLAFARFLPIDKALLDNEYLFVGELNQAMTVGDLQLFLQPKVNFGDSSRIVGAEALIRWDHPAQGLLSPGAFLQQIENSNSRTAFAQFVIRQSGLALNRIQAFTPDFELSFNLSAYDLQDLHVLAELQRVMRDYNFPKNTLQIEINESQTSVHIEFLSRSINAVRELGYSISLDDFGTGMSSLAYFSELPVDVVKIDQAFLKHIETSESARHVVRSLVGLCKGLNRTVVVEGVETSVQAKKLSELGCNLMQGYFFGKPLSVQAFVERIVAQVDELQDELS